MAKLENKIYHGAAYYPEVVDFNTVKKDIEYMKQLGINVVRIGEFAWALLEPEEDSFNIGIFDKAIEEFEKNNIKVIMCTPTATPPRWLTKKYPDSLILNKWMVRANHGSREHVCFNNPDYIRRSKIICEKLAEHYGKNKNIIAWQLHNEYNCPPVDECLCDNCQSAFREWLKEKYGTIDKLNDEWCSTVWSTRYNSFDDIIAPRPTPNGHSSSLTTNYTLFTFDSVTKYNKIQADILNKYINVPLTHNTNKIFHINQEGIFNPLDFVSFDNYLGQDKYLEICFEVEMCRNLIPGAKFWEMETSCGGPSANIYVKNPVHKRGFVKAEAVNQFFAGSQGISYWIFRQHRGGTEMPHAHIVNAFGTLTGASVNVLDVSKEIKKLEPFLTTTETKKAEVAILYSDEGRAFMNNETLGENNYLNNMVETYGAIVKTSCYRDIIYQNNNFEGYKVIVVPYIAHLRNDLILKLVKAAENGSTIIVGPYSGWRTASNGYYTDCCFGPIEKYFGQPIIDCDHTLGGEGIYSAFKAETKLENMAASVKSGIGKVKGSYFDGQSLICENKVGKGKFVFVGTRFSKDMQEKMFEHFIGEKVIKKINVEEGIMLYERYDALNEYVCLVNMSDKAKHFNVLNGNYCDLFTGLSIKNGVLESNDYMILKFTKEEIR